MTSPRDPESRLDRVVLLLLFALFLLLSPLVEWWAADDAPWYAPYLVWGAIIVLAWRVQRSLWERRRDGL